MKNLIFRFYRNSFRKAIVLAVLISMVPVKNLVAMPFISASAYDPVYESETVTPSPSKFRALSYTMHNSLLLMVHLENPQREKVSIRILNSRKNVVYRKELGKPELYVGKFNLQELPDDNYTLVVQSGGYSYTRPFSLQTNTRRVVKAAQNTAEIVKQETI